MVIRSGYDFKQDADRGNFVESTVSDDDRVILPKSTDDEAELAVGVGAMFNTELP